MCSRCVFYMYIIQMDLEIAFMGLEKYFLTKQIEIKNFNFMSIKSKKKIFFNIISKKAVE